MRLAPSLGNHSRASVLDLMKRPERVFSLHPGQLLENAPLPARSVEGLAGDAACAAGLFDAASGRGVLVSLQARYKLHMLSRHNPELRPRLADGAVVNDHRPGLLLHCLSMIDSPAQCPLDCA